MNFCNFLKKYFCKFSKILRRRGGGSAPGPPTRPAITLNRPKFFLRMPLWNHAQILHFGRRFMPKSETFFGGQYKLIDFPKPFFQNPIQESIFHLC